MDIQALKVYWRPGCSSCVRVKEFLSGLGVDYESINVSATPEAMEDLRSLGVRTVPVVTRGKEYVFAQELADVSRFLGRQVEFRRLPAPALVEKWLNVLHAAQHYIQQIPLARLGERATEGRDRSIRDLAYHIYQVADAFLQAVEHGNEDIAAVYNAAPPPQDIQSYSAAIIRKLESWWSRQVDKACSGTVKTYYGAQPLHHLLERSTWHSAQHARQIGVVLERLGVRVERPLGEADYAGLPMPAGVWE